jgi:SAM-dependent methyltransferase
VSAADVPYVRHYLADLAPPNLRIAAALNGLAVPPAEDFDYCELGCGHGDTLCAVAAAHPQARFIGVDRVAAHVTTAKKLARDGALDNIGFLERDFGDLIDDDTIGELDFVVAHGVLSWISPEKRRQLLAFARAKLKPGGLLFVSYNAMPGWSAAEPLRQLLLSPPGAPAGDALELARRGFDFARALAQGGAEYFTQNPASKSMLEAMSRAGLPYVVHEYLQDHWSPMYFARVAWEMTEHDLHFAGVLPAFLNFRDAAIPESLDSIFASIGDRITFESLKDFALNEFFRQDLYVHGSATRSAETTATFLDSTPWCARSVGAPAERVVSLPHRKLSFEGPVFDALFDALACGSATLTTMMERPELAAFGLEKVRAAMVKLILAHAVVPVRAPTRATPADPNRRYRVPSNYNQMMLRRLSSDVPVVMVSAAAGMAASISAIDGLALRVLTEVAPDARVQWVHDLVGRSTLRLRVGDREIDDPAEQAKTVLDALERLVNHRLAKLVELGILAPA